MMTSMANICGDDANGNKGTAGTVGAAGGGGGGMGAGGGGSGSAVPVSRALVELYLVAMHAQGQLLQAGRVQDVWIVISTCQNVQLPWSLTAQPPNLRYLA